jgi:hypothetical protein
MKLSIELDEEMEKWWLIAKESIEHTRQETISDTEILKAVLQAWQYGEGLALIRLRYF